MIIVSSVPILYKDNFKVS